MIELIVYKYLKNALNCRISVERLEDIDKYVYIEKTYNNEKNMLKKCTIAIQSYAPSFQETLELNENVKKAMLEIVSLDDISSCKLINDYKFDDLTRKKYRYQALFNITYY